MSDELYSRVKSSETRLSPDNPGSVAKRAISGVFRCVLALCVRGSEASWSPPVCPEHNMAISAECFGFFLSSTTPPPLFIHSSSSFPLLLSIRNSDRFQVTFFFWVFCPAGSARWPKMALLYSVSFMSFGGFCFIVDIWELHVLVYYMR